MGKERFEKLQMELMNIISEQNREKFLEYDVVADVTTISEIKNGQLQVMEKMEGFISQEKMGLPYVLEEDQAVYKKNVERCMNKANTVVFDVRFLFPGRQAEWHRVFLMSVTDEAGVVDKIVSRIVNINEQKLLQEIMKGQAERDSLSEVYNHVSYEKQCEEILSKHDDVLFVMIDVDDFKHINTEHGRFVGDEVIRQVGKALNAVVNGHGCAGRLGGDEFSVCIYGVQDKDYAIDLCIRIREALRYSFAGVEITLSMGASYTAGESKAFSDIYYEADKALYYVKENGKNRFVFADEIEKEKEQAKQLENQEIILMEDAIVLDQRIDYCAIVRTGYPDILYMNEAGRNALGITVKEISQLNCHELFPISHQECVSCTSQANHVHVLDEEESAGLRKYIPDGKFIVQSQYTQWDGEAARLVTFMDVNDHKHMEACMAEEMESQETLAKCWSVILESNSPEADYTRVLEILQNYYDADCCAIITKFDGEYKEVFEYHKPSAQNVAEGIHNSMAAGVFERCEVLLDEEGYMRPRHIEKKLQNHPLIAEELSRAFVHNTIGMSLNNYGEIIGVLMVINPTRHATDYSIISRVGAFFNSDIMRKALTENKDYEANHDVLTRLWSREFMSTWEVQFGYLFDNYPTGVLIADIFHLREINKRLGYERGNEKIIELADLFRKVFDGYSIFRYEDDKVMVVCHKVEKASFEKMVDYAKELMAELDYEVSKGYSWKESISIADIKSLIEEAEAYLAINRQHLEKENDATGRLSKRIEMDVVDRIRNGNFRMFLQPKVNSTTGKTVGSEGLIRLFDDEKGFVPPGKFIPLLEEHNLVYLIDLFILRQSFQFQRAAKDAGKEIVPISINFSKNTLMFPKLMNYINECCETYGDPDGMISIEITETISNMDHLEVRRIAQELHRIGFSISMDDFGTSYSNLAVLTQFDFDTVKIDRSMILDIVENKKKQLVLKHIAAMVKDLGMDIVIEGVETMEQVETLGSLGCEIIQGFVFGRPGPENEFYERYM